MVHLFNTTCTISYYAEGSRNDLGEASRTLTQRASGVKCLLQPRSKSMAYELPKLIRTQQNEGIVINTTHVLYTFRDQTVVEHDIITDTDGETYTVSLIVILKSHREALLYRIA